MLQRFRTTVLGRKPWCRRPDRWRARSAASAASRMLTRTCSPSPKFVFAHRFAGRRQAPSGGPDHRICPYFTHMLAVAAPPKSLARAFKMTCTSEGNPVDLARIARAPELVDAGRQERGLGGVCPSFLCQSFEAVPNLAGSLQSF